MNGGANQVSITIDQEVELMKKKMNEMPKLLNESAGKSSYCIFRVPQSLVEINKAAYQPHIVSIGPYHHGKEHLKMIEEHKWRFLREFLARTNKELGHYLGLVSSMEGEIKQSYSESIDHINKNELAKMMVLDGIFILELFRKVGGVVLRKPNDPIFTMAWVFPSLMRDLLRLENQIPFFVLEKLFEEPKEDHRPSLKMLILKFFNHGVQRQPEVLQKVLKDYETYTVKHLLHFFRMSFIDDNRIKPNSVGMSSRYVKLIHPATKLRVAGVKFKANLNAYSFLDITFNKGLLEIPQINMDDFYSSFFLNCLAFEHCYSYCTKDFTTYVLFMRCLINTPDDAVFLSKEEIIDNYLGTSEEIARFFNNVGKDMTFDNKKNYLKEVFVEVNKCCMNGWKVEWAGFKHTYFGRSWYVISTIAALCLLLLTVTQVVFAVLAYVRPPKQK